MKYIFSFGILLVAICLVFSFKTSRIITGKVTDEKGSVISGATIMVKGTKTAVATNLSGEYSITVNSDNATLIFSAIGYQPQELKLSNSNTLNVIMKESTTELSDVVVTGYTAENKKDIAGSVSTVQIANGLQGKVLGLSVSGSNVRLRGTSSLQNRNTTPQYEIADDKNEENYVDDSWRYNNNYNTEGYDKIVENPYLKVNDNPLSTFSIDVDAASYSNVRRFINDGQLPPPGAVRVEEIINYFSYKYPQPTGDAPFSINTELSACPWNDKHQLVLIGLQGKIIPYDNLSPSNLVFLIDVSGSMEEPNKLPLVQASLKLLVDQLREQDKVSLVVYAGNAGLVLPPTSGANKIKIKEAIDQLEAGGSTAGGAGIQLAYKTAKENFVKGGNNRVILCTDGDFNVGLSSDDALENLIEEEKKSGVFLTVLGYGMGNYQDAKMQKFADKGNGNHAYIDGLNEAKKVLVNEFGGTLFTIAKDVKLQIEFNPSKVQAYRLIGYENRMLAKEDFNNDLKDAGELGSGHTVTALYEIIPTGVWDPSLDSVDALRYQQPKKIKLSGDMLEEVMNIKLRYKKPDGETSALLQYPLTNLATGINKTSDNFRFAASVAEFGMLLRGSKYSGNGSFGLVQQLAKQSLGDDEQGYRKEFLQLVENASLLKGKKETAVSE